MCCVPSNKLIQRHMYRRFKMRRLMCNNAAMFAARFRLFPCFYFAVVIVKTVYVGLDLLFALFLKVRGLRACCQGNGEGRAHSHPN